MGNREKTLASLKDEELIILIQQGHQLAFTVLVVRHSPNMKLFLFHYLLDEEDVKDVLQEVWIEAAGHFYNKTYSEKQLFKEWLHAIGFYMAMDCLKKREKEARMKAVLKERAAAERSSRFLCLVARADLMKAIRQLPRKQRLILGLHFFKKLKFKDIALRLRLTVGAVTAAYSRALSRLRTTLKPSF